MWPDAVSSALSGFENIGETSRSVQELEDEYLELHASGELDEAVERIKRSLALMEVAKRESIEVPADQIEARVKELMEQYSEKDVDDYPPEEKQQFIDEIRRRDRH